MNKAVIQLTVNHSYLIESFNIQLKECLKLNFL